MLTFILFLTCIAWTIAVPTNTGAGCAISIQYLRGDLAEPQPLLLRRNGKRVTTWYPDDDDGLLTVPEGDYIYLACPGKYNYLKYRKWGNEAKAVCVKNTLFDVNGDIYDFSSLTCKYQPEHDARYMGSAPCLGRHSPIEIGFNVSGAFMRVIELCRDDKTYTTYYTKFTMTKMIGSYQSRYPRPRFLPGRYYPGLDMDQLYKFENQVNTIGKILNSMKLARRLMKKSVQFLARGHMVAKADFVYGAMQRATFWYMNTAPQWQSFNAGNWNWLEDSVRYFAANSRLDLDVYTGVHGQMTMEDVRGKQQPVYLHIEARVVPAPKFYWKVIYDPLSKRGTAFVGLNDPFIESITNDVFICRDISKKIDWLSWRPANITAGVSYACTVDDLRKAVPTVPVLDVIDILI